MRSTKTLRFFSRKNAFERILGRKDRSNEIYRAHITRLQDVENLILARRGSRRAMLRGFYVRGTNACGVRNSVTPQAINRPLVTLPSGRPRSL